MTNEQIEYYKNNGYSVIDTEIPESVLNAVVDDLNGKYTGDETIEAAYRDAGRIQDAWKSNAHVKTLALLPKILSVLQELYQRKPLAFQTLNFPVGTEQLPHSDTIHFNSMPSGFMCGVWIALEDMDENNGTLIFYPGSHKLPEVTMREVMDDEPQPASISAPSGFFRRGLRKLGVIKPTPPLAAEKAYPLYEKYIGNLIEKNKLEPKYAIIKKGQALIWSANLLHGGSPHKDKNRTRHSQVTHYFFENCRYYTPLMSNETDVQWRNPDWIS